jgi:hypothetical protein
MSDSFLDSPVSLSGKVPAMRQAPIPLLSRPLPVAHDLGDLSPDTLWQEWSERSGGWTHAFRFHETLPLVKIMITVQDSQVGVYRGVGFCYIVEPHIRCASWWGEEAEKRGNADARLVLGGGSPLLRKCLRRSSRPVLRDVRADVDRLLLDPTERDYLKWMCAIDLLQQTSSSCARKDMDLLSCIMRHHWMGELYYSGLRRRHGLTLTPFMAAHYEPEFVFNTLYQIGMSGHEISEAVRIPETQMPKTRIPETPP